MEAVLLHLFFGARRALAISLAAALMLIAVRPAPLVAASIPSASAPLNAPLEISKQGSFYIGGSIISGFPAGEYMVNQMYVEYQIPLHTKPHAYPIIMIHGSSHTGKTFDETPDGREGWKTYFLRHGYSVYVVDQAGSARSGFNASAVRSALASNDKTHVPKIAGFSNDRAWTDFRIGTDPYTPFPQSQFPIENKEQYFAQLVPNTATASNDPSWSSTINDLGLLIDKIGPAVVMVHSQSGKLGWRVAVKKFPLVKAVVSIEPLGGCKATDTEIATVFKSIPVLAILGDHPEGNPTFTNSIITTCTTFMQKIDDTGGHGSFLQLPQAGFRGNSHVMMLEKNNLQIADWIINWLDEKLE
jgi:pimeloyl-ACP methyl ester carboxylesterase